VHLETNESWLAAPFLVVEAVDGSVASDNPPYLLDRGGWFLQGSPEQWTQFEYGTIEVLARIHRIDDPSDLGFLVPQESGGSMLERQLTYQSTYYEWARDGISLPTLERALHVLTRTLPSNTRMNLNWGDSRPGNIIYRGFRPAAVLDWEMATVGPPEVDLGWLTFIQRFFDQMAERLNVQIPSMFQTNDVIRIYEDITGDDLDDLSWYELFAGLRFGIILCRMSLRSIACGLQEMPKHADDLMMFAPLLQELTDTISVLP
jgi:aminoglycoside phosphotransferase (APT) family kinase protein